MFAAVMLLGVLYGQNKAPEKLPEFADYPVSRSRLWIFRLVMSMRGLSEV
jgi:hypothetical protein